MHPRSFEIQLGQPRRGAAEAREPGCGIAKAGFEAGAGEAEPDCAAEAGGAAGADEDDA